MRKDLSVDPEEEHLLAMQEEFQASKKASAASLSNDSRPPAQHSHVTESGGAAAIKEHIPGDRIYLDLSGKLKPPREVATSSSSGILRDVVEHETVVIPQQSMKSRDLTRSKKIDWRAKAATKGSRSRFAESMRHTERSDTAQPASLAQQIDDENNQRLRDMSTEEIETQKKEILSSIDPTILAALKKRRQTRQKLSHTYPEESSSTAMEFGPSYTSENIAAIPQVLSTSTAKAVTSKTPELPSNLGGEQDDVQAYTSAAEASEYVPHVHSTRCVSGDDIEHEAARVHFPEGRAPPDLDPTSATFLQDLKSKYFPSLDHDPSSLAWMQPPTVAEDLADYHESHDSLMPAQLRFDFHGDFVAPRTSREVDGDLGLHHHADAPLAAGYTLPELAHLCRSSYPAQACIAIQTAGRILYKTGKQFYGESISGKLQGVVDKSMIEATLLERARDRHLGVSSYATEALWQASLGREGRIIEGQ